MKPQSTRAKAAIILNKLLSQEGSLANLLTRPISGEGVQEFPLLQEICFGTCRWYYQLDAILKLLMTKPLKAKDGDLRCLLLIGLYQLHFLRVPSYAVVNETVAATQALGKGWAKGLINGVLRNFLRDEESLVEKAQDTPSSKFAHPEWFIKRMMNARPDDWQTILQANNQHPPMTLRVNESRLSREAYLSLLSEAAIPARSGLLASSCIYLESPCSVDTLPGFADGLVSVQDEASQLIPALLRLEKGASVLDACAAPGGKTSHILESGHSLAKVVAIDNDARRLEKLDQNLLRLNLSAQVIVADAGDVSHWWDEEPFDRILLDAPCSATGIIRRHPDIKILRRPDDLGKLRQIQNTLLSQLWTCLKPGGLMLYSTCSVLPEENSEIVAAFLQRQSDAKHEEIQAQWGVECPHGRQLLPHSDGNDGFYFATLRKST